MSKTWVPYIYDVQMEGGLGICKLFADSFVFNNRSIVYFYGLRGVKGGHWSFFVDHKFMTPQDLIYSVKFWVAFRTAQLHLDKKEIFRTVQN